MDWRKCNSPVGKLKSSRILNIVFLGYLLFHLVGETSCISGAASDVANQLSDSNRIIVPVPSLTNFESLSSTVSPSSSKSLPSLGNANPQRLSNSEVNHNQTHPHHRYHNYNDGPELVMPSPSPVPTSSTPEAYSPSWYSYHMNDPRMGFFFSNAPASTSADFNKNQNQEQKPARTPLVARPRSLSLSNIEFEQGRAEKIKKRKKKKVKRGRKDEETSAMTIKEPVSATEMEASRTFFFMPLLAYLVPVFIAQMFGMGMIPAAAFITLPIFLLPLGLTAAVFLI